MSRFRASLRVYTPTAILKPQVIDYSFFVYSREAQKPTHLHRRGTSRPCNTVSTPLLFGLFRPDMSVTSVFNRDITVARLTSRITMAAARPYRAIASNSTVAAARPYRAIASNSTVAAARPHRAMDHSSTVKTIPNGTMTAARPYRAIVSNSIIASGDNIRQRHHGSGFALKSTLFCSRSMLFYSVLTHFYSSYSSLSKKLVPSPLPATPKLSSTVAPKSQQVERSPRSRPPAGIEGDQASNGTSSRVWSVPV